MALITRDVAQGVSGKEAVTLDFYTEDGQHAGVATFVLLTPSARRAYKQYYKQYYGDKAWRDEWRRKEVIDGVHFVKVIYR